MTMLLYAVRASSDPIRWGNSLCSHDSISCSFASDQDIYPETSDAEHDDAIYHMMRPLMLNTKNAIV